MGFNIYGIDTLVAFVSHCFFIYLSFWALQSLRMDQIFKKCINYDMKIKILYILFSIVIGFTVSSFFLDVIFMTRNLIQGLIV